MSRPLSILVLLLASCDRGDASDKVIREQHAQAAEIVEARRMVEQQQAEADALRTQRLSDALAIESYPPDVLSEDQLHQLLGDYYCGDCHFPFPCGSCERGGTYLDTLQEMLRQGTVIPGNAESSPLIGHMRQHEVQLPDEIPPVSEAAIELISDFINQLPALDAGSD